MMNIFKKSAKIKFEESKYKYEPQNLNPKAEFKISDLFHNKPYKNMNPSKNCASLYDYYKSQLSQKQNDTSDTLWIQRSHINDKLLKNENLNILKDESHKVESPIQSKSTVQMQTLENVSKQLNLQNANSVNNLSQNLKTNSSSLIKMQIDDDDVEIISPKKWIQSNYQNNRKFEETKAELQDINKCQREQASNYHMNAVNALLRDRQVYKGEAKNTQIRANANDCFESHQKFENSNWDRGLVHKEVREHYKDSNSNGSYSSFSSATSESLDEDSDHHNANPIEIWILSPDRQNKADDNPANFSEKRNINITEQDALSKRIIDLFDSSDESQEDQKWEIFDRLKSLGVKSAQEDAKSKLKNLLLGEQKRKPPIETNNKQNPSLNENKSIEPWDKREDINLWNRNFVKYHTNIAKAWAKRNLIENDKNIENEFPEKAEFESEDSLNDESSSNLFGSHDNVTQNNWNDNSIESNQTANEDFFDNIDD